MPLQYQIRKGDEIIYSSEPGLTIDPDNAAPAAKNIKPKSATTDTVNMLANALIAARNKRTKQQTEENDGN
jgi:hypothetical protein